MSDKDLTLIDGVRIEVGKSYWIRHKPSNGKWTKVNITRITPHGHPWRESAHGKAMNGILTDCYEIQELTSEVELEQFARTWLDENGFGGFAHHTPFPNWFAKMYNDFKSDL